MSPDDFDFTITGSQNKVDGKTPKKSRPKKKAGTKGTKLNKGKKLNAPKSKTKNPSLKKTVSTAVKANALKRNARKLLKQKKKVNKSLPDLSKLVVKMNFALKKRADHEEEAKSMNSASSDNLDDASVPEVEAGDVIQENVKHVAQSSSELVRQPSIILTRTPQLKLRKLPITRSPNGKTKIESDKENTEDSQLASPSKIVSATASPRLKRKEQQPATSEAEPTEENQEKQSETEQMEGTSDTVAETLSPLKRSPRARGKRGKNVETPTKIKIVVEPPLGDESTPSKRGRRRTGSPASARKRGFSQENDPDMPALEEEGVRLPPKRRRSELLGLQHGKEEETFGEILSPRGRTRRSLSSPHVTTAAVNENKDESPAKNGRGLHKETPGKDSKQSIVKSDKDNLEGEGGSKGRGGTPRQRRSLAYKGKVLGKEADANQGTDAPCVVHNENLGVDGPNKLDTEQVEEETPRKRRGRPRKAKDNVDDTVSSEVSPVAKRVVTTPSSPEVSTVGQRKVGRPKRGLKSETETETTPVLSENDQGRSKLSDEKLDEMPALSPRPQGRGRAKKTPIVEEEIKKESAATVGVQSPRQGYLGRRTRGRPPRLSLNTINWPGRCGAPTDHSPSRTPPQGSKRGRGRGRPRKSPSQTPELKPAKGSESPKTPLLFPVAALQIRNDDQLSDLEMPELTPERLDDTPPQFVPSSQRRSPRTPKPFLHKDFIPTTPKKRSSGIGSNRSFEILPSPSKPVADSEGEYPEIDEEDVDRTVEDELETYDKLSENFESRDTKVDKVEEEGSDLVLSPAKSESQSIESTLICVGQIAACLEAINLDHDYCIKEYKQGNVTVETMPELEISQLTDLGGEQTKGSVVSELFGEDLITDDSNDKEDSLLMMKDDQEEEKQSAPGGIVPTGNILGTAVFIDKADLEKSKSEKQFSSPSAERVLEPTPVKGKDIKLGVKKEKSSNVSIKMKQESPVKKSKKGGVKSHIGKQRNGQKLKVSSKEQSKKKIHGKKKLDSSASVGHDKGTKRKKVVDVQKIDHVIKMKKLKKLEVRDREVLKSKKRHMHKKESVKKDKKHKIKALLKLEEDLVKKSDKTKGISKSELLKVRKKSRFRSLNIDVSKQSDSRMKAEGKASRKTTLVESRKVSLKIDTNLSKTNQGTWPSNKKTPEKTLNAPVPGTSKTQMLPKKSDGTMVRITPVSVSPADNIKPSPAATTSADSNTETKTPVRKPSVGFADSGEGKSPGNGKKVTIGLVEMHEIDQTKSPGPPSTTFDLAALAFVPPPERPKQKRRPSSDSKSPKATPEKKPNLTVKTPPKSPVSASPSVPPLKSPSTPTTPKTPTTPSTPSTPQTPNSGPKSILKKTKT